MFYKEKKPCPFDRNTGFLFYVCESVNFHTELIRLFYSYFKCLGYTIACYCNLSCTFLDTFYCTIGRYSSNFLIAGFVCDFSGWSCFCCDLSCLCQLLQMLMFCASCQSWIFNCYCAGCFYVSAFSCNHCFSGCFCCNFTGCFVYCCNFCVTGSKCYCSCCTCYSCFQSRCFSFVDSCSFFVKSYGCFGSICFYKGVYCCVSDE